MNVTTSVVGTSPTYEGVRHKSLIRAEADLTGASSGGRPLPRSGLGAFEGGSQALLEQQIAQCFIPLVTLRPPQRPRHKPCKGKVEGTLSQN